MPEGLQEPSSRLYQGLLCKILQATFQNLPLPRTPASRDPSEPCQRLLSLLVSNLSRISSNAPVPMRAPLEGMLHGPYREQYQSDHCGKGSPP